MLKRITWGSVFLLLSILTFASSGNEKTLNLKKVQMEIKLDGVIDQAWSNADSASNFFQFGPEFGKEPTNKTIAKVLTTNDEIYFLIKCYQDRQSIELVTGTHDNFGGDVATVLLDTFDDDQTGYRLSVTAAGVRMDARISDDGRTFDYNWDGIWFSATKVYDWGYAVEIRLPYKSVQYDRSKKQWGIDFERWVPDNREDLNWCTYEQNEGLRISKFAQLNLNGFEPSTEGLNLEIFPVGIGKAIYNEDGKYDTEADIGLDVFYNPSPQLTYQLTVNPDYAQIEADPFNFNISRYESYFDERRPFFTQGNEIFRASGRERGSGFYRPLELFYSRRIGKILPDGSEAPFIMGTKAFGRINEWDYGGLVAVTGEHEYYDEDEEANLTEPRSYYGVARVKKQIMDNSSVGALFVGKFTGDKSYGVIDVDGAFRGSDWQLAYQVARSFAGSEGDFAVSAGFRKSSESWVTMARTRHVGNNFDVSQIGFVPWKGTTNFVGLTGPRWYFDDSSIRSIMIYAGPALTYEKVDNYTDYAFILGYNMSFKAGAGFEINLDAGKSRDADVEYSNYSINFSSWYFTSPRWGLNVWGGYTKTYNFSREYLGYYGWLGSYAEWRPFDFLEIGTRFNAWFEVDPNRQIEDVTYNARPYMSVTPFNNLNVRIYVDNLYRRSSDRMERMIFGLLFSYNFSPKSWIYFAINEVQGVEYGENDEIIRGLHTQDRAGVLKVKYLYYF